MFYIFLFVFVNKPKPKPMADKVIETIEATKAAEVSDVQVPAEAVVETPKVETVVETPKVPEKTEIDEALEIMAAAESAGELYGAKLKQIADEHNERTVRNQATRIIADVLKHAARVGSYKYEMTADEPMSADLIKYLGTQGLTVGKETTSYSFFSGHKYTYVINYGPAEVEPETTTETSEPETKTETAETKVDSEAEPDAELQTN